MIVYRICQTYPPGHNPIDGAGAAKYGGRWNSKGTPMVYTASSLSLARSELARHVNLESIPYGFRVYEIQMPDNDCHAVNKLPSGWNNDPEIRETKIIGDKAFEDTSILGIKVPSVCDIHSYNYLLNPRSKRYNEIIVVNDYPFVP